MLAPLGPGVEFKAKKLRMFGNSRGPQLAVLAWGPGTQMGAEASLSIAVSLGRSLDRVLGNSFGETLSPVALACFLWY